MGWTCIAQDLWSCFYVRLHRIFYCAYLCQQIRQFRPMNRWVLFRHQNGHFTARWRPADEKNLLQCLLCILTRKKGPAQEAFPKDAPGGPIVCNKYVKTIQLISCNYVTCWELLKRYMIIEIWNIGYSENCLQEKRCFQSCAFHMLDTHLMRKAVR